jgi:hypothetical protein
MYIPKGKDDNMRKLLLVFLFLSGIMTVSADEFNYLTFARNDGTMKSISIDNLKLSFAGGNVVAATGDETLTMPLSDLAKMFFAATAAEEGEVDGISELTETSGTVSVYTVSGTFAGSFANASQAHSQLAKGLYVVKTNGRTYKMTVR